VWEEDGGDLDVIMNHLALGKSGFRVEHLVEIRDGEFAVFDDEFGFLAHGWKNQSGK
jgi:hypothetical protein